MPAIPPNNYLSCKQAITNEVCVWSVGAGWFHQEKTPGPTPGNCTESWTGTQFKTPDSTTPSEVEGSPHGMPCRGLLIDFTLLWELSELLKLRLWEMAPGTSGKDFQRPHSPHQEMNPLVKKFGSGHIPPSHRYYSSSLTMLEIMAWKEMPPFKSTGESWIHLWGEVQYFNLGCVSCLWRCLLDSSGCWMSVTWRGTTSQWCNSLCSYTVEDTL